MKTHPNEILLASIFAILSSSTIAWTLADETPPLWDPADHISAAYDYYHHLASLDLAGFARDFFVEPHYYAPFIHLVSALVFLALGASRLTGIVVNIISLAALLASVYWLARMLYGREPGNDSSLPESRSLKPSEQKVFVPGVLAALLVGCYHFPAWLMHDAFLDFPLTAIVALSFALLIRAGDFRARRYAVLLGIAAGLGMLTKQTFAFFFVLPALYVTIKVLWSADRRAILNLSLAGAIAAALAAIWYVPHLDDIIAIYNVNKQAAISENEAPLFGFVSNVYYTYGLLSSQMQLPFGMLWLFGVIYSLARRRRESVILYLWLVSGIAIFTFIANKEMRYTVPVLPAAALLSVCWLSKSKAPPGKADSDDSSLLASTETRSKQSFATTINALKSISAVAIVVWAFVSFFNAQWPLPGNGTYLDLPQFRWMIFGRNYYGMDHRPLSNDWSVPEIVRAMNQLGIEHRAKLARLSGDSEEISHTVRPPSPQETVSPPTRIEPALDDAYRPTLGVVVNLPHLNPSSVALYARLLSQQRAGPPLIAVDWLVADSVRDRIGGCEYLLVRTGLDRAEWVAPIERYVEELIKAHPERFTRVVSFPVPLDQAEAVIYKCEG